jgi:hypothetical protein
VAGCVGFPGARSRGFATEELGNAIAERVGGVVVGQRPHVCCPVQYAYGIVAIRVEAVQRRGKDG